MEMAKVIDCKGLACPKPVILTKKELDAIESGEVVSIVDNDTAVQNLQKLSDSMGCKSAVQKKEGLFYVTITKSASNKPQKTENEGPVILVSSDKLGTGDDKLGSILMKSYMFALSEADVIPKTLLFLNSGVKLTTEGTDVLESLKKLQEKGTNIMSCGTCLDFYNLKDKVVIGTVTNMYTIVDAMNKSSNTIKL